MVVYAIQLHFKILFLFIVGYHRINQLSLRIFQQRCVYLEIKLNLHACVLYTAYQITVICLVIP